MYHVSLSLIRTFSSSARHVRYFEFPLLEKYLSCKQRSHYIAFTYILRNLLLVLLIVLTCFYLGFFHLNVFQQEEFNCRVTPGFLVSEPSRSEFIKCKLVSVTVFQVISVVTAVVYLLLLPVILFNISKLLHWDKQFLNVYEMLPAFDLLTNKMLGCPINDLNIIIMFLRANISELKSFGRLSVLCTLKKTTRNNEKIDTVVDFMTLLVGMDEDQAAPDFASCEENMVASETKPVAKPNRFEMVKKEAGK